MTTRRLSDNQLDDIRDVLAHGDEIIQLVASDLEGDQLILALAKIMGALERDGTGLYPVLLLDKGFAEDEAYQEAIEESEGLGEEEKSQFQDLQERFEPHTGKLWRAARIPLNIAVEGRNRWGERSVERRLDLPTGIPMLRMIVTSADDGAEELFDTEESTHAFIRNATGLLWSVAETYEDCSAYDHDLPEYL